MMYTPEIHIYPDRIEVYGYRVRQLSRNLKRSCQQSPAVIPYICANDTSVLLDIVRGYRRLGFRALTICKISDGGSNCVNVKLARAEHNSLITLQHTS